MKRKLVRLVVYVEESHWRYLTEMKLRRDQSLSALVRTLLDASIEASQWEDTIQQEEQE